MLPRGISRSSIAYVSKSGATAAIPAVTGIAHCGNTPPMLCDRIAGNASDAPTMKCVIADAMAFYSTVSQEACATPAPLLDVDRNSSLTAPRAGAVGCASNLHHEGLSARGGAGRHDGIDLHQAG